MPRVCRGPLPRSKTALATPVAAATILRGTTPQFTPPANTPAAMPSSTTPPPPPRTVSRGFRLGRERGSRGKLLTNKAKKQAAAAARVSRAAGENSGGGPAVALGGAAASVVGGVPVAGSSAVEGAEALSKFRVPVGPTAADVRKNLLPGGPRYLIHRAAVPGGMCVLVLRIVSGLASTLYNVIFNHKTVDDFERNGTMVESIMAPGGGGRLMAKLGGLVPRWLGATSDDSGAL